MSFLLLSTLLVFETVFLTELGTCQFSQTSWPPELGPPRSASPLLTLQVCALYSATPAFTQGLGVQTQVCILPRQALYYLSCLPPQAPSCISVLKHFLNLFQTSALLEQSIVSALELDVFLSASLYKLPDHSSSHGSVHTHLLPGNSEVTPPL